MKEIICQHARQIICRHLNTKEKTAYDILNDLELLKNQHPAGQIFSIVFDHFINMYVVIQNNKEGVSNEEAPVQEEEITSMEEAIEKVEEETKPKKRATKKAEKVEEAQEEAKTETQE